MKNEVIRHESISINNFKKRGNFKHRALQYLGFATRPELSRAELKFLRARAKKLKKTSRKNDRSISHRLLKQFNF